MSWTTKGSLGTILNVHVVVVVTVTNALELPATTILELLGNLPPVPVVSNPAERGSAICSIDFKDVEAGAETKGAEGKSLPEAHPLDNTPVFVDGLTKLETERGIRLHGGGLNEWLELVAGMCRCSLNANNALDRLLTKHWETEASGYVRELLVISPLDLPLVTSIVIVMARGGPSLKSLLVVNLLGLREPSTSGLPPAVIELEVDVVKMAMSSLGKSNLVVFSGDVALLVEVLRANLCNVHINHVRVVAVDLHHLLLIISVDINVMARANVLVRENDLRLSVLVARSLHVPNLKVAVLLGLIYLEVEVLLGDHLVVGSLSKLLLVNLVLEFDKSNLVGNDFIDSLTDSFQSVRATILAEF